MMKVYEKVPKMIKREKDLYFERRGKRRGMRGSRSMRFNNAQKQLYDR
jgi:hypothetical protein